MYILNFVRNTKNYVAEEVENAAVVIPRALIITVILSGTTAFAMLVAILFCAESGEDVLSSRMSFPFISIFLQMTGSKSGTTALVRFKLVHRLF